MALPVKSSHCAGEVVWHLQQQKMYKGNSIITWIWKNTSAKVCRFVESLLALFCALFANLILPLHEDTSIIDHLQKNVTMRNFCNTIIHWKIVEGQFWRIAQWRAPRNHEKDVEDSLKIVLPKLLEGDKTSTICAYHALQAGRSSTGNPKHAHGTRHYRPKWCVSLVLQNFLVKNQYKLTFL